jgi:hypothetical protein
MVVHNTGEGVAVVAILWAALEGKKGFAGNMGWYSWTCK